MQKKERKYLVLDHDGIIHPNELLQHYLKQIDYRACDEYRDTLIRLLEERAFTKKEFDLLIVEHLFVKDQVLEEVREDLKGRIPYNLMYTIENTCKDVIKTIKEIYEHKVFDGIILNSHCNSMFEIQCKDMFHKEYLPFVQTYFPLFHQERFDPNLEDLYQNNNRKRTNKALFLMQQLKIPNLRGFYAIDDSSSICSEYKTCGAKQFFKDVNDQSVDIIRQAEETAIYDLCGRGAYTKRR